MHPTPGLSEPTKRADEHQNHGEKSLSRSHVSPAPISAALQMFRISGGNDKQGFPMKQGVLSANRVRLLMHKGVSCYRQRRVGERKRKSVRGCIVAADLAVLNLVVTKKGDQDIPGLTDAPVPRRLGPKRANNVRKLFNLGKVRRARSLASGRRRRS